MSLKTGFKYGKTQESQSSNQGVHKYDHSKMEKLFKLIHNISKADQAIKMMKAVLEAIKDVINCSNNQFFIFEKEMVSFEDKKNNQISSLLLDTH